MSGFSSHLMFSNICKAWKNKHVLDGISLDIQSGECSVIAGKNGSGKSTLLRILSGLLPPDTASITIGQQQRKWRSCRKMLRERTMYLHQTPYLFDGDVTKNLRLVRSSRPLSEAMEWADITHLSNQSIRGLSGGERQRVALARAWLKHPEFLFLDEPTANLDHESRQRTVDLLCRLKEQGVAILIASHDIGHINNVVDRHLHLANGKILAQSKSEGDNKLIQLFLKEA